MIREAGYRIARDVMVNLGSSNIPFFMIHLLEGRTIPVIANFACTFAYFLIAYHLEKRYV